MRSSSSFSCTEPIIAVARWKLGEREAARQSFRQALELTDTMNQHLVPYAQAEAGDIEGALETASLITAGGRAQALGSIAELQARGGDIAGAVETAAALADDWVKAGTLARIGAEQARLGDARSALATFERAIEVARLISADTFGTPSRASSFARIARERARSGDALGAFLWACAEESPFLRAHILVGVAEGVAERRRECEESAVQAGHGG
jgi:tetratricopeptide (TPR) repeat protein